MGDSMEKELLLQIAMAKALGGNGESGGGGGLPPVTSDDNGKVMRVVDGAITPDDNLFVISCGSAGSGDCDKTYDEIQAAADAGKTLVVSSSLVLFPAVYAYAGKIIDSFTFIQLSSTNSPTISTIYITRGNGTYAHYEKIKKQLVPIADNSSVGKTLVVGGTLTGTEPKWEDLTPFIVNLTPTSEDLSGVMDKTPAEICQAKKAGRKICAVIPSLDADIELDQFVFHDTDEDGVDDTCSAATGFWYQMNEVDYYVYVVTSYSSSNYYVHLFPLEKSPLIVTLTPTASDYSGTMDTTVGEIYEAWQAGREIWFDVGTQELGYAHVKCSQISLGNSMYPSFEAQLLNPNIPGIMYAFTGFTDDPDKMTYAARVYLLNPVS